MSINKQHCEEVLKPCYRPAAFSCLHRAYSHVNVLVCSVRCGTAELSDKWVLRKSLNTHTLHTRHHLVSCKALVAAAETRALFYIAQHILLMLTVATALLCHGAMLLCLESLV